MVVVLMAGFVTSCGDDDSSSLLDTYTFALRVSDKGTMSDVEYNALTTILKTKDVTVPDVPELAAKSAFEQAFKAMNLSELSTVGTYTLEYSLKNSKGKTIAIHYIYVKDGQVSTI